MAQTALETFWEQLPEILPFSLDSETAIKLYEKYQEAKQMEREQRFKDFKAGQDSMEEGGKGFEQYYTQTYGSKLQNETNSTPNQIPPPPTPPASRFLKEGKEPPKRNQLK